MNRKKVLQDIALRLKKIRETLGVSLDWLILDRGPMFYKENRKMTAERPGGTGRAIIRRTQDAGDKWVDKAGRYFLLEQRF
ncbi:MAG: hypothetical protein NT166_18240 [Candidatus Aminicenantes bacterium]|nr:hypothetical protein [Candidatus Aminicenantes bacterium]